MSTPTGAAVAAAPAAEESSAAATVTEPYLDDFGQPFDEDPTEETEESENGGDDGSDIATQDEPQGDGGDGTGAATVETPEGFVPVAEVEALRGQIQDIEPYREFLDLMRGMGNPDAFRQLVEQSQQAAREAETQRETQGILDRFGPIIEAGEMSAEVAEQLAPVIAELRGEVSRNRSRLDEITRADTTAAQTRAFEALKVKYPRMDEETVRLAQKSGQNPEEYAKRTHERMQNEITAELSRISTDRNKQPSRQIQPGGQGNGGRGASTIPDPSDTKAYGAYLKSIGLGHIA